MNEIAILNRHQGEVLSIANGQYRTIISGKDTNGKYAIIEMTVPPGAGPGPHAHKDIEEIFYVVSGELEFRSVQGTSKAGAGDTIRIPKGGAVHAFKNTSATNVTLICTVYPAGLEEMFSELSRAGADNAKAVAERYGNQLYPPDYFDQKK